MPEHDDGFHASQATFTAWLRDPDHAPAPAHLDDGRLRLFERMVFNDIHALVGDCFPRCVTLLGLHRWQRLLRRYLVEHRCTTPLFTELAGEFVRWLRACPALPHPALAELAHFEWVGVALHQLDADALPGTAPFDPLHAPLRRSPLAWPLFYRWPVHLHDARLEARPVPAPPHALLARRDAHGRVHFMSLGSQAAHLLVDIGQHPGLRGSQYLQRLSAGTAGDPPPSPEEVRTLLQRAVHERIIGRC